MTTSTALTGQRTLVNNLAALDKDANRFGRLRHATIKETHISLVLLKGRIAYKIKKPVDLGFLDFSTLSARHFYCQEELRLNKRFGDEIYIEVIPIGGSPTHPVLYGQPAIEYAVKMRRFAQSSMMDQMLSSNRLSAQHIDLLAQVIARFHSDLPAADKHAPFCDPENIRKPMADNFSAYSVLRFRPGIVAMLADVQRTTDLEYGRCLDAFHHRASSGKVRECHGDLHLGNIVVLNNLPVPFDCIEFSPSLRWIDVISEISFPVMDLIRRGHPQFAWRLLNAYLEITGDYDGCKVLRFYLTYRAMVRAKIATIQRSQRAHTSTIRSSHTSLKLVRLAGTFVKQRKAILIITHGLPGCGKSTFSQLALEKVGAIRLRSDVERKRLYSVPTLSESLTASAIDIYTEDATRRTYAHLLSIARDILNAGFPVIIDAAFLKYEEREAFRQLAYGCSARFIIASLIADQNAIAPRLAERSRLKNDASEADMAIHIKLRSEQESLRHSELNDCIHFNNSGDMDALASAIDIFIHDHDLI